MEEPTIVPSKEPTLTVSPSLTTILSKTPFEGDGTQRLLYLFLAPQ